MELVRRRAAWVIGSALLLVAACQQTGAGASGNPGPAPRTVELRVTEEAPGQSFRYLEPETRRAKTALRRADIPEAARRFVMVYDERLPADALAAGEMVLVDLTEARPDGTFPAQIVSTVGHEAHVAGGVAAPADRATDASKSPAGATPGDVILFVTSWCPHCKRAEAWLKQNGTRFTKLDVERDTGARELLARLFRENQVPDEYANSVPVVAVGGKVLLGFDEAAVARALRERGTR